MVLILTLDPASRAARMQNIDKGSDPDVGGNADQLPDKPLKDHGEK